MKIGIIPFHYKAYQLLPHITEEHINAINERICQQLTFAEHEAEIMNVRDLQVVKHTEKNIEGLEYVGNPKYHLIVKADLVTTPDYLSGFLWLHVYAGEKYESIIASKSSYAFGKEAYLDGVWQLTADALFEASANAQNIAFHFESTMAK